MTASPPKVLTIYGVSTVNAHVRNVPNRLLSPLWQSLHLMETSVVFTAHFALVRPTFTALRVRTVHPKLYAEKMCGAVPKTEMQCVPSPPPWCSSTPVLLSVQLYL